MTQIANAFHPLDYLRLGISHDSETARLECGTIAVGGGVGLDVCGTQADLACQASSGHHINRYLSSVHLTNTYAHQPYR